MKMEAAKGWSYLALAWVFGLIMLGTTIPAPLYPLYQDAMGFSALTITVIFAVYALGVMLALLVMGNWSDQLGRRPLLLVGLLSALISGGAFLLAQGLPALLIGRFLSGMSAGIFTATATVTIVELAPQRLRARAVFAATAANMGGLGAGPIFAGALAQTGFMPLHFPYLLHVGLVALSLGVVYWLPETVKHPAQARLTVRKPGVPVAVRPIFVPAAVAAFAGFAMTGMFTSVTPMLLGELMGQSHGMVVGLVAGCIFFASILGQSAHQRLAINLRLPLGGVIMAVGALVLLVSIQVASLVWLFVGGLVSGVGQGLVFRAGMTSILAASPPDMRAQVAASFFLVAYLAISLPVVGLGAMIGHFNLVTAGMTFAGLVGGLALLAVVIVVAWKRPAAP